MRMVLLRLEYLQNTFLCLPLTYICFGTILGISLAQQSIFIVLAIVVLAWVLFRFKIYLAVLLIISSLVIIQRVDSLYGKERQEKSNLNIGKTITNVEIVDLPEHKSKSTKVVVRSPEISERILLDCPLNLELRCGDILTSEIQLQEIPEIEEFDYAQYLHTQGIWYVAKSRSCSVDRNKATINSKITNGKTDIIRLLNKNLPESHTMLIAGLLWGQRANLSEEFENSLSRTGTTHIIAVSGFNVSIIIFMLLNFAGLIPRKVVIFITFLILFIFLFLVGFGNLPALRAGIMGGILLLTKSLGRRVSVINLLMLTITILLLMNPYSLYSISFQLSICAFAGVVGLTNSIEHYLGWLPGFLRSDFASTLAAIISTSPLTLSNFSVFSIVAPIVNLLVLPLIPLMMMLGIVQIISSFIGIGEFSALIVIPVYSYVVWVISLGGSFPFSSIDLEVGHQTIFIFYYLSLVIFLFERSYRNFSRIQTI